MLAEKRLTQAYKSSKVVHFDDDSKFIIFSDSHRGDNSLSDEFSRNQNIFMYALEHYYKNGYSYIEAGDGDELWEHKKFKHIRLAHSDVFMCLKKFFDKDRLFFLYGNHNMILKKESFVRRNLFYFFDEYKESIDDLFRNIEVYEGLVLKHRITGQEILTVHGHQGDLMNDQLWLFNMFMLRYFWRFMHLVGFVNPSSPSKNLNKRHKIEKMYNKWIEKQKIMLICGHTHRPKFPKNEDLPYFNSGCCIHTRGITGIEICGGMISTVDWRIRASEDGVLKMERVIIRGPEPIEKYDFNKNPGAYDKVPMNHKGK